MNIRSYAQDGNVVYPVAWQRPPLWQPGPWKWWFAWRPVRVEGRLVWLRWIARRQSWRAFPACDPLGEFHPWRIEYAHHPFGEERDRHDRPSAAMARQT